MDDSIIYLTTSEIRLYATFSNLFPKRLHVLHGLKQHIKTNGFDQTFPLILAYGPWTEYDVLLDGHCRKQMCEELSIETVPIVRRFFETEEEAVAYMIHIQKDRRNLTDAEIMSCVGTLDEIRTAGRPKKLASSEANFGTGKSAKRTAAMLGTSRTKVEKVRTILKHGDDEMKQSIRSGKTINKAYGEVQASREEKEDGNGSTTTVTAEAPEPAPSGVTGAETVLPISNAAEKDHEDLETGEAPLDSSVPQIRVLAEPSSEAEYWPAHVINGFDPRSIDYLILGQGVPPGAVNNNQQVFVAPWMAAGHDEIIDPQADAPSGQTAPRTRLDPANLENYDAEGWYELEKQWAAYIPGFVPELPEGIEDNGAVEETTVEAQPAAIDEAPQSPPDPQENSIDPALEKIAHSLEIGEGESTRLERWAKRSGVIVQTLLDDTRIIDRQKLFTLVENLSALNDILKGPVRPEYAWFPQTFHRLCRRNGHDVPAPDCTDGFEVNLLLDHLSFKGVYSGGRYHPQGEEAITRKLKFLVENWADVCVAASEYGFVQGRPDIPSYDWLVCHGESVFNCIHHKMQAVAEFRLNQLLDGTFN